MYAIIETGSKQYWVEKDQVLSVETLDGEPGAEVVINAIWGGGEGAQPGQKGKVTATIVRQFRAPKIIVFKKRVKKGYKKTQGHRQNLTEIRIKDISLS